VVLLPFTSPYNHTYCIIHQRAVVILVVTQYQRPIISCSFGQLEDGESVAVPESSIFCREGFRPLMPVLAGHSRPFRVQWPALAAEVRVILSCFFGKKLQHALVELCLSHSDKSVLTGVDLQDHRVNHYFNVDPSVVANAQLVVGDTLDLR
jgi:hypothetical protein